MDVVVHVWVTVGVGEEMKRTARCRMEHGARMESQASRAGASGGERRRQRCKVRAQWPFETRCGCGVVGHVDA